MSVTSDSIFLKRDENKKCVGQTEQTNIVLSRVEVAKMIPAESVKLQNTELAQTKTEWRWRIFKFPDKEREIVEISYKSPDQKRLYINNKGNWVNREVGTEFDIYVTSEYYHYTDGGNNGITN